MRLACSYKTADLECACLVWVIGMWSTPCTVGNEHNPETTLTTWEVNILLSLLRHSCCAAKILLTAAAIFHGHKPESHVSNISPGLQHIYWKPSFVTRSITAAGFHTKYSHKTVFALWNPLACVKCDGIDLSYVCPYGYQNGTVDVIGSGGEHCSGVWNIHVRYLNVSPQQ